MIMACRGCFVLAAASAVAAAGCGGSEGAPPSAGSTVVDSAGIRIVTNSGPQLTLETAWRISEAPVLTIGVVDGAPEEQLFQVSDAALLSDGRIVIANSGTSELRIFNRAGQYLRSLGGEGEGPGEFRRITVMDVAPGDSIFVWDQRSLRLSVLSLEEGFERTVQLSPPYERALPVYEGRFSDGTLLVLIPTMVEAHEIVDGVVTENPAVYMRYSADGLPLDTLGSFRGSRSMIKFLGDARDGFAVMRVPFGAATSLAIAGTSLYEGDGTRFELRRIGATSLEQVVRRAFTPAAVTRDLMNRDFEARYEASRDRTDYYETIREGYAAMPVGDAIAAFDQLRVSADGDVWVRAYPLPGDATHGWSVFSPDGEWLGEVGMPASLEIYEVGTQFVVGRQLDELEVEHVVLYEIIRP